MKIRINITRSGNNENICQKENHKSVAISIFLLVFGLIGAITPVFGQDCTWCDVNAWFLALLLLITIFYQLVNVEFLVRRNIEYESCLSAGKLFSICFTTMCLMGGLFLLIYYPGTTMYDTLAIVSIEGWGTAAQHPWFYIWLIKIIKQIVFAAGGSYEQVFVVMTSCQILLQAFIFSYCIVWMARRKLTPIIRIPLTLFYVFCPWYCFTMVNLVKDIPFSLILVAWMPILYDICSSKGELLKKKHIMLVLSALLVLSLLRNNGVYVSAVILLSLFFVVKRKYFKNICALVLVLALVIAGSNHFEDSMGIQHLIMETVGIPLQQLAGVIYYDGEISDEDAEFINQIISLDYIKEKYSPYSADKLKWGGAPISNSFLSANKVQFLKTWAKLLIPNFGIYVNVYLRNTYGFWSFATDTDGGLNNMYTTVYVQAFEGWLSTNNVNIKSVLPQSIQSRLENFFNESSSLPGSGLIFWIFMFFVVLIATKKGIRMIVPAVPIMANWLTIMISTPIAFQWRYTVCALMALPLIVGMAFIDFGKTDKITHKHPGKADM